MVIECALLTAHQSLRVEVGVVLPLGLILRRPLVLEHRVRVDAAQVYHLRVQGPSRRAGSGIWAAATLKTVCSDTHAMLACEAAKTLVSMWT